MRSHFTLPRGVTAVCAVAGATAALSGNCSAGPLVAADYATNSTYASSWSAGQNGGYGFGAWSFDGTVSGMTNATYPNGIPNPGAQQTISSASAIGTAWTLYNSTANPPPAGPGLSDVGRAITEPGGLQPGQTLEVVLQSPTSYQNYRGFDILALNGTNNDPAGVNMSAIRTQVFEYYNPSLFWVINDYYGPTRTTVNGAASATGIKYDLTLTSTNTYLITLTPLSNPSAAYSQSGPLNTNLPINYVSFRLYLGPSSGPNDTADNFEISSMAITGLSLNIQLVGTNAILSWATNVPGFNLASSTSLGPSAVWNTNLPLPIVVSGRNVVTNPITGSQQFFRLQQ